LVINLAVFWVACGGESPELPSTPSSQNQSHNGQNQSSNQQIYQGNGSNQIQAGNSTTGGNNTGQSFDDESRFGEVGKVNPAGSTEGAQTTTTPALASGTVLQEWRYGKLPSNTGQGECTNHPKKSECASKTTTFEKGGVFGTNRCKCS